MNARRLMLSVVAAVVGSLVFACVPALAAEAPTIVSESVSTVEVTAATLEAEIDPGAARKPPITSNTA